MQTRNQKWLFLSLIAGLVLCATIALYWPGLHGPFLLDDLQTISPSQLEFTSWSQLIEISLQNDTGPLGRPISVFTFTLNNLFFGTAPFSYKVTNLIIHLLTGIALGVFIYLLVLLQPRVKQQALPIAFLTALIWLIHPLQVSTVLYPVQRMTQLCHLFTLLGLNTYLYGRMKGFTQQPHATFFMGLSLGLFYPLAVFSKETGIIFPWYLICIEYFLLRFHCPDKTEQKRLTKFHYILSLSLLFGALLYYWMHLNKFLIIFAEKNITLFDRLLTQTKVLVFYIKLILMPQVSKMGLYHDDFVLSTHFDKDVITSSMILFCCLLLIYLLRRRARVVAFGLAWFFISHTVESTALPLELVFEHRNYLASVGLLLIPVYHFVVSFNKCTKTIKIMSSSLTLALIILLMTLTYNRSLAWSTPIEFLSNELYNHPQSARAHIEVANVFLLKEQYDLALNELEQAQQIQPFNAGISLHEMLIFCRDKSIPPAFYETVLQKVRQGAINPYVILTLDYMVKNLFQQSCPGIDKNKLIDIINTALQNPFLEYKPLYTAVLYHLLSGVELLNNNVDQSRTLLLKSFQVYPTRLEPLIEKAYLEMKLHLYPEAQKTIKQLHAHTRFLRSPSDKIAKLDKAMEILSKSQQEQDPSAFKESKP